MPAAGWDGLGLQAAALRSHAQHHAAVLVLAFERSDVTFGGSRPDAGRYVPPLVAAEPYVKKHVCFNKTGLFSGGPVPTRRTSPVVLNRVGEVPLLGGRRPRHQPFLHVDALWRCWRHLRQHWEEWEQTDEMMQTLIAHWFSGSGAF